MSTPVPDDKMVKQSYCLFFLFCLVSFLALPLTEFFPAWFGDIFYLAASLVGIVWQVRVLRLCRRNAIQWFLTAVYFFLAVLLGQDFWRGGWRSEHGPSDLPQHGPAAFLGGPATTLYVIVVILSVLMLCYYRLDRRSDPTESPKNKIGRRLFYAFTATQLTSLLLITFALVVALYVYDMPLDWERMHRFWKKTRLVSPAVFSLLFCFLGMPLALLALVFRFRILPAIASGLILTINFLFHMRFVHHLTD